MKLKHELLIVLAGLYVVIAVGALFDKRTEQDIAQAHYCEMVHMNQRDPDKGWPDFHHTYDRECTNGKPKAR